MADLHPPPTYSQEDPTTLVPGTPQNGFSDQPQQPQILILPTVDAINFQNGYLGAGDERAAIEGEVHIKGADRTKWSKLTISLRTYEATYEQEVELNSSEIVLHAQDTGHPFPSVSPFSIPLPPDTPQSIQTPQSSLAHTLTASLYPITDRTSVLSGSITVYTRRYTPHAHVLPISPEIHSLQEPIRVDVQIPRSTFKVGEPIPVYITIPPPHKDVVVDKGLRLRNMRIELVRTIRVKREAASEMRLELDSDASAGSPVGMSNTASPGNMGLPLQPASAKAPQSPLSLGSSYTAVIARSGASCRFHSSRHIRLRFVLHPPSTLRSPTATQSSLPGSDYAESGFDGETVSISQTTLLHSVTFSLNTHISLLDTKQQLERTSTLKIPITIIPAPARLPEVSLTIDEAYSKKHDRPPVKTNRYDDTAPRYPEGEAGPSVHSGGAPPPFDERDAPPPFFSSAAEASTSAGLPTFLESEREVLLPDSTFTPPHLPITGLFIEGEGTRFGFHPADQFDGHSEDMQRSATPPPSMEMAAGDTDLTALTEIQEPSQAIEALTLVLDQREESMAAEGHLPPPPPPAMDDPSDPPPSIDDSTFRRPDDLERESPPRTPPPPMLVYREEPPILSQGLSSTNTQSTPRHAPPPYLNSDGHHDQENIIRPPPYYIG